MKGIIIEKNIHNSVLLLSDGSVITVRSAPNLDIGSVVSLEDVIRTSAFYIKKLASMAASIILVVFIGLGVYAWKNPVQYINIDINPSIELSVNCFNRIVSINSLNDEGWRIIRAVSLKADTYESGIRKIISSAKELGYIHEEGDILISISSNDKSLIERTQANILEKVTERVEVMTFDKKEYIMSAQNGMSPGKRTIIEKVLESGAYATEDDLMDEPVKELIKKWNENKSKLSASGKKEENIEVNGQITGENSNAETDKQKPEGENQEEQNTKHKQKRENEERKKEELKQAESQKASEKEKQEEEKQKEKLKQQSESQKAKEEERKEEYRNRLQEEKERKEKEKEDLKQKLERQKAEAERRKEEQKEKYEEERSRKEKEIEEWKQKMEEQKAEAEKRREEQKKKYEEEEERKEKEIEEWKQKIEKQKAEAEKRKEEQGKKREEEKEREEKEKGKQEKQKEKEQEKKNEGQNKNSFFKEMENKIEEKTQEWKKLIDDKIEELKERSEKIMEEMNRKKDKKGW